MFLYPPPPPPPAAVPITIFIHGTQMHTLFRDKDISRFIIPSTQTPRGLHSIPTVPPHNQIRACMVALACADNRQFPLDGMYTYGWSGALDSLERSQAGKEFFDLIKALSQSYDDKYRKKAHITVITHSHGGNVLLEAARLHQTQDYIVDTAIMLALPVQNATKDAITSPFFNHIISLHSHDELVQILDQEWANETRRAFHTNFETLLKAVQSLANNGITLGSERHFASFPSLIQAEIGWKTEPIHENHPEKFLFFEIGFQKLMNQKLYRGVAHTEFTTTLFFSKLPSILSIVTQEASSKETPCFSLLIDG